MEKLFIIAVFLFAMPYTRLQATCELTFKGYRHPSYLLVTVAAESKPDLHNFNPRENLPLRDLVKRLAGIVPIVDPERSITADRDQVWLEIFRSYRDFLTNHADQQMAAVSLRNFIIAMSAFFSPDAASIAKILGSRGSEAKTELESSLPADLLGKTSTGEVYLSSKYVSYLDTMVQSMCMQLYGQRFVTSEANLQQLFERIDIGLLQRLRNHLQIIRAFQSRGELKRQFFQNLLVSDGFLHRFSEWASAGRSFRTGGVAYLFAELESSLSGIKDQIKPKFKFDHYDHYFEFHVEGVYMFILRQLDAELAAWMRNDENLSRWLNGNGAIAQDILDQSRRLIGDFFADEGYRDYANKLEQTDKIGETFDLLAQALEDRFGVDGAFAFTEYYWGVYTNPNHQRAHQIFRGSLTHSTHIQNQEYRIIVLRTLLDAARKTKEFDLSSSLQHRSQILLDILQRDVGKLDPIVMAQLESLFMKGAYLSFEAFALGEIVKLHYREAIGHWGGEGEVLFAFDVIRSFGQTFDMDSVAMRLQLNRFFMTEISLEDCAASVDPDARLRQAGYVYYTSQSLFDAILRVVR